MTASTRRLFVVAISALASLALTLAGVQPAAASNGRKAKKAKQRAKKAQSFYFQLTDIKLAPDMPPALESIIRAKVAAVIAARAELVENLEDAPDPATSPKKFALFLARKNLRAFKVNVEVTRYRHELKPMPAPRKGQQLRVTIELRTFGVTLPGRVMAFAGKGSATIGLEIGKRLRKRDSEVANKDASGLAIEQAIERSITVLRSGAHTKKSKQKRSSRSKAAAKK